MRSAASIFAALEALNGAMRARGRPGVYTRRGMVLAHSMPRSSGFASYRAILPRWGALALVSTLGACGGGDDDDG